MRNVLYYGDNLRIMRDNIVHDQMTVCKTYRVKRILGGSLAQQLSGVGAISKLLEPTREIKETLAVDDASVPPPLSEEESYVKVRDRVIQIEDD